VPVGFDDCKRRLEHVEQALIPSGFVLGRGKGLKTKSNSGKVDKAQSQASFSNIEAALTGASSVHTSRSIVVARLIRPSGACFRIPGSVARPIAALNRVFEKQNLSSRFNGEAGIQS
jgi:hypothetical protein